MFRVPPPCIAAFSSRFVNTWQISTASIGTKSTSSGSSMRTFMSGKEPPELAHGVGHDLLHGLRRLLDGGVFPADAGDGEQVLHHADEPLGVVLYAAEQLAAALLGGRCGVLQQHGRRSRRWRSGACAGRGTRRCSRSARILARSLSRRSLSCFLTTVVMRAGAYGHGQHGSEGQRIARDGEVEGHVGEGEDEVHAEHGHDAGRDAPEIAVRDPRGDVHAEHEQQRSRRGALCDGIERRR